MDPYILARRFAEPMKPDPKMNGAGKPDMEILESEVSSSEGEVQRWLSPYGSNPDPVARQKGLKLYEEMMTDDQIAVCVGLRKKAMLTTSWEVEPGDPDSSEAEKYADFVKHVLDRLDGTFEDDLEDIYSAVEFGFSLSELNYMLLEDGPWKGKIGLRSIKTREPYQYSFKTDGHGNILGVIYTGIIPPPVRDGKPEDARVSGLWFLPGAAAVIGSSRPLGSWENPFPLEKFIHYAYNPKFQNPYGRSDLLPAFRYWNAKRYVLRFWNIWLERYAAPFTWATVDTTLIANKKKIMEDIDDFIRNLQSRSGFRAPKGVELHVEGGASRTGAQSYEDAVEAFNRWIAHGIFCPNLLGFTGQGAGGGGSDGGGRGSFALGKKHFEAFMWVVSKMQKDTQETIVGDQIIKRLMVLNFGEVDPKLMPKFRMRDVDDDQTSMRATILSTLAGSGFVDVSEDWVREYLSLPEKAPEIILMKPGIPGFGPDGQPIEPKPDSGEDAPANRDEKKPEEKQNSDARGTEAKRFLDERPSYEAKVRFAELAQALDSAEARFAADINPALTSARDEFMRQVRGKGLLSPDGDASEVQRLTFPVGEMRDTVAAWMVKLHLDSKLRALEEIGRAGADVQVERRFESDVPNEAWEPIPPEQAADFFNKKVLATITTSKGKKVLIRLASAAELAYYDERAFAVSGIVRDDILNEAKQILLTGIRKMDPRAAEEALSELFSKYIAEGDVDPAVGAPARVATIVRTNTLEAVNQGRRDLFEDPDVKGFVSYWQYSSVLDERTTDYCRCMDGKVFQMDDMAALNPPAHYNCRSIGVPVTRFETAGKEVTISAPCPDRMTSFLDVKRDPVNVGPAPSAATKPSSASATPRPRDPSAPPQLAPRAPEPPKLDAPPAPKSRATQEAEERLRDELMQVITTCPYTFCRGRKLRFTKRMMNVGEFECEECSMPFRVSNKGDLYLFDAGTQTWERATQGLFPAHFSKKEDGKG